MFARYASALSTGTLVTLAILLAMPGLIRLQPGAVSDSRTRHILKWVRPPRPEIGRAHV